MGSLTCEERTITVGQTKWNPLELPLLKKIATHKLYCIPGGITEISAWKMQEGDSHHIPFQLTSRAEDSWVLENDSGSSYLRQVVILIAVVVPDVGSSLEQINTSPGIWYAATDVASAFFFTSINKDHQKHSAFSRQGQQHTFTIPPQRCINSLALCQSFSL